MRDDAIIVQAKCPLGPFYRASWVGQLLDLRPGHTLPPESVAEEEVPRFLLLQVGGMIELRRWIAAQLGWTAVRYGDGEEKGRRQTDAMEMKKRDRRRMCRRRILNRERKIDGSANISALMGVKDSRAGG